MLSDMEAFCRLHLPLKVLSVAVYFYIAKAEECTCMPHLHRCDHDRVNSGSCQLSHFNPYHGVKCCRPFCTCKQSCGPNETRESGECSANHSNCCPRCRCEYGTCDVRADVNSCGNDHKLCCTISRPDLMPSSFCPGNTVPIPGVQKCGSCECKKTCGEGTVESRGNTCDQESKLCCKSCSCKSDCDANEIDIGPGTGTCELGKKQCCQTCACKKQCNTAVTRSASGYCFIGMTLCCTD